MGRPAKRTPAQNNRMWGLVARMAQVTGSTKEEATEALRRHVREVSGQEHSSRLTAYQARQVIERMQRELDGRTPAPTTKPAPHEPWGKRGPGPRGRATITQRQIQVLEQLGIQVGLDTPQKRMTFSQRQCRKPWPQTQGDYDSVYGGLEAMALRMIAPRDAWRRAQDLIGNPGLNSWQQGFLPDLVRQFEGAEDIDAVLTPHKIAKLLEAERHCGVEVAP